LAWHRLDLDRTQDPPSDSSNIFELSDVYIGMNTAYPPVVAPYALGYAKGRHAAKENVPDTANPFQPGTTAYHGWADGHYDEHSARRVAIARHSSDLWTVSGNN
jgi:hypothetical protein